MSEPAADRLPTVRSAADPMAWYLHRGVLEPEQHDAGLELAKLFRRAFRSPVSANHLEITNGSSRWPGDPIRDGEALSDYGQAMRAMREPASSVVWWVCCWGEFANTAAGRVGVSPRRGVALLRAGLDDLRRFFDRYR